MKNTNKTRRCNNYEVENRHTRKCTPCPKGFIVRDSYYRTSSKKSKKNGKNGKNSKNRTYVHEACIKSRGIPGKTSLRYQGVNKGIGPLKKGELGKHGYHNITNLLKVRRRQYLTDAVKEYGAPRIVRKLGALRTYLKNIAPDKSSLFYEDQRWVRRMYDDQFKGDLKQSKLYRSNNVN
jgi:hypothetical protein